MRRGSLRGRRSNEIASFLCRDGPEVREGLGWRAHLNGFNHSMYLTLIWGTRTKALSVTQRVSWVRLCYPGAWGADDRPNSPVSAVGRV